MQSFRQYEMRGFYWAKIEHWGERALLRLKSVIREYQRLIFNPKAVILLNAMLFALCAMPLSVANAATVTLGWSPNDEPDLEGYVVYRNPEKSGPPYKYSDEVQEDELDDPLHPRLKLTGLKNDAKYYVALTAFNNEGIESSFSNEVCIEVIENAIQACSEAVSPSTNTSSDKGGSGGGGGGGGVCFITSVSDKPSTFTQFVAKPVIRSQVLAMLFLLLVLIAAVKLGFNKANQTNSKKGPFEPCLPAVLSRRSYSGVGSLEGEGGTPIFIRNQELF